MGAGREVPTGEAARLQKKESADQVYALGFTCYQKKEYDDAIKYFDMTLTLDPTLKSAYLYRANAVTHLNNPNQNPSRYYEAVADYEVYSLFLLETQSANYLQRRAEALQKQAEIYKVLGHHGAAIRRLAEAVAIKDIDQGIKKECHKLLVDCHIEVAKKYETKDDRYLINILKAIAYDDEGSLGPAYTSFLRDWATTQKDLLALVNFIKNKIEPQALQMSLLDKCKSRGNKLGDACHEAAFILNREADWKKMISRGEELPSLPPIEQKESVDRTTSEYWYLRGQEHDKQELTIDSLMDYQVFIALEKACEKPDEDKILQATRRIGKIYFHCKQYAEAIHCLTEVIEAERAKEKEEKVVHSPDYLARDYFYRAKARMAENERTHERFSREDLALVIIDFSKVIWLALSYSGKKDARAELEKLLDQYERSEVFEALKTIKPLKRQAELLRICAYGNTQKPLHPLAEKFWKHGPLSSRDVNSGTLKKIVEQIKKLEVDIQKEKEWPKEVTSIIAVSVFKPKDSTAGVGESLEPVKVHARKPSQSN